MTVNLDKNFLDAFGRPIENGRIADKLGMLLFNLSTVHGTPVTPEKKYAAYQMCQRINSNASAVELSLEEAAMIKDACAEHLSAGAYGQVVDLLEKQK